MAEWEQSLLKTIDHCLKRLPHGNKAIGTGQFHLAVLIEPYLSLLMAGKKTIESRFCRRKWMPYGMVNPGDTLILKRSCGPVVGICKVSQVFYYDLSDIPLETVRQRFGPAIAVTDEAFWQYQQQAQFVSLFRVQHVTPLPEIYCGKSDRRAWVVMHSRMGKKSSPALDPAEQAREMIRQQFSVSLNPAAKTNPA